MVETLIIVEHQEIFVSKERNIDEKIISEKDKEELFSIEHADRFNKKTYVFSRKGSDGIKANSIVGSISLKSGLIIEILPKFAKDDLTDETIVKYRKNLLRMIQVSNEKNFISSTLQSSKISVGEMPLIRYMIELFSESLLHSLRNSVVTTYNKTIENSSSVRGNILLTKTLQNNIVDKSKVYISYNKHSSNNLLMQIFKTLAQLLLNDTNLSYRAKQYLYEVYILLDSVTTISLKQHHFEKVVFNRLNDKYETLFKQAEFIFNQYMPFTSNINSTPFWAILFNMDYLFEKFCAYLLRRSNIEINEQSKIDCYTDNIKTVRIQPDFLILKKDKLASVADAKWKLLERKNALYGLEHPDFWQLFSYMNLVEDEEINGYFIVPKNANNFDDEIIFDPIKKGSKPISIFSIDFSLEFEDILKRYRFKLENGCLKIDLKEKKEQEVVAEVIEEEKAEIVLEDESDFDFEQFIYELMLLHTLGQKRNKIHHNKEDKRFRNLFYLKKKQRMNEGAFKVLRDTNIAISELSWHLENLNIKELPDDIKYLKNLKYLKIINENLTLTKSLLELKNLTNLIVNKSIVLNNIEILKELKEKGIKIETDKGNNILEEITFPKEPKKVEKEIVELVEPIIKTLSIKSENYHSLTKEEKQDFIDEGDFTLITEDIIKLIMQEKDIDILEDFTYNKTLPLRFAFATYNNNLDRKKSEVVRLKENLINREIKELKWIVEWTIEAQENYIRDNITSINREILLGYVMSTALIFKNIKENIIIFNTKLEELSKKKKEANFEEYYNLALESFKNKEFKDALEFLNEYQISSNKKEILENNIYKEIGQPFKKVKKELLNIREKFDIENRVDIKKYIKELQLVDYPILNFLTTKLSTEEINHLTFILTYLTSLDDIDNKFIKTINQFFELTRDNLVNISEEQNKTLDSNVLAWKDLETGLIWEVKNDYNINQVLPWKKCFDYAKKLNSTNYANHNNWRVPTIQELKTLHISNLSNDFYIKRPLSNNITKDIYWSATEYKVDRKPDAYIINFKYIKDHEIQAYITHSRSIRCVMG